MTISYTGKEEAPEFMKAEVESFIEGLYEDQKQGEKVKVTCTKSNEGFATAGVFSMWHALETLRMQDLSIQER